jgi:uncharacterized protein (DUF3820 family)
MSQPCHDDFDMSDDEKPQEGPLVTKMPFGKHRGELICDLAAARTGRAYLRWLLTKDDLRDNTRRAVEEALVSPEPPLTYQEAREMQLYFGKYKGQTVGHTAKTTDGRKYLTGMANWKEFDMKDDLREGIHLVISEYEQWKKTSSDAH